MLTDTKTLIARFERQAHRMGELWERCQEKGWPEAESAEFTALRDKLLPATRTALETIESAATAALLERIAELEAKLAQRVKDDELTAIVPGSWGHLKLMMGASSWEGRVEISDVLANIDDFSAAHAAPEQKEPKLDKPARVGNGTFGVGVSSRMVVEAAQRQHEYHLEQQSMTPEQRAEQDRRDEAFKVMINQQHDSACPAGGGYVCHEIDAPCSRSECKNQCAAAQAPNAQQAELVECGYGDGGRACCEGGPCAADMHNESVLAQQAGPMSRIAKIKLADLITKGYRECGVMIEMEHSDGKVTRGAVSNGGMVIWWHPEQMEAAHSNAQQAEHPERVTKEMWQKLCESQAELLDIQARRDETERRLGLAQQAEAHPVGYLIRKADQPNTKGWLIPADQVGSYQRDTLTREPVYTAPPKAVPLTEAQAKAIAGEIFPMAQLGNADAFHARLCEVYGIGTPGADKTGDST